MGFRTGGILNVWEITRKGEKYTDIKVSSAVKSQKDGKYRTDFTGFIRLFGQAHEANVQPKQRIKLVKCDVVSPPKYNGWENKYHYNFTCNELDIMGENKTQDNTDETPI